MNLFFDTSALVKLFHEEEGTRRHGRNLGLRTLDALQLATFSLMAEQDWTFVVADRGLASAARAMGYSVANPLEPRGAIP